MRKLWTIRWFRVLLGVVLTAALLAPVVLPALQMQRQEPENPIRKENIQPVRRLSFGDGDGGTLAAAPLTQETGTGGSQSGQEQNPEPPPEEQTGENVPEQLPEQPRSDPEPQPGQESGEQPGERTDGQPDDAGDETQPDALDLGLVLTWYRYGGERYRSLCPSDTTVRQDVRTAQLPDGKLRYELELRGLDAVDSQITNVEISENNGAFAPADERGSIAMQVGPQGEDSYYTLRVQAVCTHVLEDGARQEQETEFCFVLVYSDELDLEAQLLWMLADGGTASLRCQPGSRAACTVRNDELEENRDRKPDQTHGDDRHCDLPKQNPLTEEFRYEPAESERLIFLQQRVAFFEQQHFAGELAVEIFLLHKLHLRFASVLCHGIPDRELLFHFRFFRYFVLLFRSFDRDFRFSGIDGQFLPRRFFHGDFTHAAENDRRTVFLECHCGICRSESRKFFPGNFYRFCREIQIVCHFPDQTACGFFFGNSVFMKQTAHIGVASMMLYDCGKTVERGVASVCGTSGELDFDKDRFSVPSGSQLRTGEEDHFPLSFAEWVEYGKPLFRHTFRYLRTESEKQDPVSVVEAQKDGRSEIGRQFICVCVISSFG